MLRIATRKSPLALWQADRVQALLLLRGHPSEQLRIVSEGDRILDRSLAEVGGKGLFVKELEEALEDGRADLAVHSAKDVPFALPPGFSLAAFPQREDPRDALVSPRWQTFAALPRGARVGTSSLRRAHQLLARRPDLLIVPIRGNVATRLARTTGALVDRGGVPVRPADSDPLGPLDAVVLALAGLIRLGLDGQVTEILPIELSLPAAGQGALAIEVFGPSATVAALDDAHVARCVRAERAVLEALSGGCTVPIAAYAVEEGAALFLRAVIGGTQDGGSRLIHAEGRGEDPARLGAAVAEQLISRGARALL